jgi:hypothetical protein
MSLNALVCFTGTASDQALAVARNASMGVCRSCHEVRIAGWLNQARSGGRLTWDTRKRGTRNEDGVSLRKEIPWDSATKPTSEPNVGRTLLKTAAGRGYRGLRLGSPCPGLFRGLPAFHATPPAPLNAHHS